MENFSFKKKYGQNFLQNKNIIKKIAECGEVESNSLIIEVGPGSGNLTVFLAELYNDSNILAYEIDDTLEDILFKRVLDYNNVVIKYADFLKSNLISDASKYEFNKLYFISNVPYYITTPILFKLIQSGLVFEKIVMMVQKEVGDRFSSCPGSREYGALTVIINYYFYVKKEFYVDRNQFNPRPNVDSVVISFKKKGNRESLNDEDAFIRLVHDSFQFKRKTIRNNLKKYDLQRIEEVLNSYSYNLSVRAEELPYYVFVAIANELF